MARAGGYQSGGVTPPISGEDAIFYVSQLLDMMMRGGLTQADVIQYLLDLTRRRKKP